MGLFNNKQDKKTAIIYMFSFGFQRDPQSIYICNTFVNGNFETGYQVENYLLDSSTQNLMNQGYAVKVMQIKEASIHIKTCKVSY